MKPLGQECTLIIEKNATGHRLYYVNLLARAALARGDKVAVVLGTSQIGAQEIDIHLRSISDQISAAFVDSFELSDIEQLSKKYGASITVVPDGDLFAISLARAGRWKGTGELSILIMRERAQPMPIFGMQFAKTLIRSQYFRRAGNIASVRVTYLKAISWRGRTNRLVAIDPVTLTSNAGDVSQLRETWGMDPDRYWFGVLGAISERKNCAVIAEALLALPGADIGFLIAGKCNDNSLVASADHLAQLKLGGASVIVIDRLLSDVEIDSAVSSLDCVVLAHSNEGSSGLFGKAAASGTRVVAAGARSLKADCEAMPSGASWSKLDIRSLSHALRSVVGSERPLPSNRIGADTFAKALL